jgi:hypothetical protein
VTKQPSPPEPTGLPAASQNLKGITRPDQSTYGPRGNQIEPRRIPHTLDRTDAATPASPLGQPAGAGW